MRANQWPGPDEKQVIDDMLANPYSVHWEKCSELMKMLILKETGKYHFSFSADFVDEVVQNAMLSVAINLQHFRFDSKLTTWLTKIAYTRTIDALRAYTLTKGRSTPLNTLIEGEETEKVVYEPETATIEDECLIVEEMNEVLAEITVYIDGHAKAERNHKIVQMVFFEERTLEEAAREVGVSSAVASYVIRTLRRHLVEKFRLQPPSE